MKIAQTMGNESLKAAIKNAQKDVNKKKKAVEVAEKILLQQKITYIALNASLILNIYIVCKVNQIGN